MCTMSIYTDVGRYCREVNSLKCGDRKICLSCCHTAFMAPISPDGEIAGTGLYLYIIKIYILWKNRTFFAPPPNKT